PLSARTVRTVPSNDTIVPPTRCGAGAQGTVICWAGVDAGAGPLVSACAERPATLPAMHRANRISRILCSQRSENSVQRFAEFEDELVRLAPHAGVEDLCLVVVGATAQHVT